MEITIYSINDLYILSNLSKLRQYIENQNNRDFYTTINGGFLSPSILSTINYGKSMIDILNQIPIDFACFGNHEFDIPHTQLLNRIQQFNGIWLNSNITPLDDTTPYTITEKNNIRIGWIGLCTTDTPILSNPDDKLNFNDIVTSASNYIKLLKPYVDIIVALTHQTIEADNILAERVPELNIILGGHELIPYFKMSNNTMIIKSGINCDFLSTITIKKTRENISYSAILNDIGDYQSNKTIDTQIEKYTKTIEIFQQFNLFEINLEKPLSSKSTRDGQQYLCQVINDVIKDSYQADVVITNSGIYRGNTGYSTHFTYQDLLTEFPFDSNLVEITMTGKQIHNTIIYSENKKNLGYGGYLQLDSDCIIENNSLSTINNTKVNLTYKYKVVIIGKLLLGMDNNSELVKIGETIDNVKYLVENGLPIKFVIFKHFIQKKWKLLDDGYWDKNEIREHLNKLTNNTISDIELNMIIDIMDKDKIDTIDTGVKMEKILTDDFRSIL